MQKSGNEFRLIVKLFDAIPKESCLWGKFCEQEINSTDDIFSISSDIAKAIANELKAVITPVEKRIIEKVPTTDLSALDFYQKGREKVKAYENLKIFNRNSGKYFFWIVSYMKHDPLFSGIRHQPEFQKIVKELDAQYNAEHERVGKWLKAQKLL